MNVEIEKAGISEIQKQPTPETYEAPPLEEDVGQVAIKELISRGGIR